ncbi:MAG: sensor histidine kinase, partial [Myxococcota bacterium]
PERARGMFQAKVPEAPPLYVEGWFQIDPDGSFRGDVAQTEPASSGRADATDRDTAALKDRVVDGLAVGSLGKRARVSETTVSALRVRERFDTDSIADAKGEAALAADLLEEAEAAREQVSPYRALQSLNRGAVARKKRTVKVAAPQALSAQEFAADAATQEVAREATERRIGAGAGPARKLAAKRPFAGGKASRREPAADDEKEKSDETPTPPAPVTAGLEVYPMVGRLIDEERLLLYRMVLQGDRGFRQGLVVDVPALFVRLEEAVIGGGRLAGYVGLDFFAGPGSPPGSTAAEGYEFVHRFAEPFDALGVRLVLEPLPGVAGAGYLYAIAVLLLISVTVGLFALYRMVGVTVRFAERRNNFVAAVTHELKTPLTAIRMYSEMLRDGMVHDEEKRQEYYGTITAESERLTRLINNVLEFSRLEQGTRDVNLVAGPLGPVVNEAAELLRPHAMERGFQIDVAIDPELPSVRFDRDAVLQVVFNLVDNALKYGRDGGDRRITIRCTREHDGVVVAVRDRGQGVAAPHLSRIFEPFYRGESELTRTAKGTGIGLALVRGLADTMGAAVSGRNLVDGGFEVALRFHSASSG